MTEQARVPAPGTETERMAEAWNALAAQADASGNSPRELHRMAALRDRLEHVRDELDVLIAARRMMEAERDNP